MTKAEAPKDTKQRGQVIPFSERLIYTSKQAADILSISERTLWTLENSGKIRSCRITDTKCKRYSRAELLRFCESLETQGQSEFEPRQSAEKR